jgi:hypothetical protein
VAPPLYAWYYAASPRHREMAGRIAGSHDMLWKHFDAQRGPGGWMVLPPHSDDRLAATALSPEKRARQIQRADYWIRTGNLLRVEFRNVLLRPDPRAELARQTESQTIQGMFSGYDESRHGDAVKRAGLAARQPVLTDGLYESKSFRLIRLNFLL